MFTRICKIFTVYFIISALSSPVFCVENKYMVSEFFDDTCQFVRQPLKWHGEDYIRFGIVAAGTALTMTADTSVREEVLKDRTYGDSGIIVGGRIWGEWYSGPAIAGLFAIHGLACKGNRSSKIGFELIEATIYSASITQILKVGFGRARPYISDDSSYCKPFNFESDLNSLPSGHVSNAFAISTVLAKNTDSELLKILAYTPAVFTAFSRVYQNYHWTSDCLLGAAIGYFCGAWVADHHELDKSQIKLTSIYPLALRFEF